MRNHKRYSKYLAKLRQIKKHGNFYRGVCPYCNNENLFFNYQYDAECCLACDTWLENACNDKNCPFCANRPARPWSAFYLEEKVNYPQKDFFITNFQHKSEGEMRHRMKQQKIQLWQSKRR